MSIAKRFVGGIVLCGFTLAGTGWAQSTFYVSTNAVPAEPYATWATGFTSLQAALDYATAGDRIYLAGHTFADGPSSRMHPEDAVFVWRHATNVVIRGGYEAVPTLATHLHPGPHDANQWPTVLTRTGGVVRILSLVGVTNCTIDSVTMADGYQAASQFRGAGGYLSGSHEVLFVNCRIVDHTIRAATRDVTPMGGGLYLDGSSLILDRCVIAGNAVGAFSPGVKSALGGGIYVDGASRLTVERSHLAENRAEAHHGTGSGGAIQVAAGAEVAVVETVFTGNQATRNGGSVPGRGGAVANNGVVSLRNVLVAGNASSDAFSDGIWTDGAAAQCLIENTTVVDNNHGVGVRYGGQGVVHVRNSIVWGHAQDLAGFLVTEDGVLPAIWYSAIGDGQNAWRQGCVRINPLFADTETYHLQSTVGNYAGGYFTGGAWTTCGTNSPLIALGDPASAFDREPGFNGGRINMGAYGNTETASKAPRLLYAPPFTIADPFTGSMRFTNSNIVDIVALPFPSGADHYQITSSGETTSLAPNGWINGDTEPSPIAFDRPAQDTNLHFYAWFTNTSAAVTLRRSETDIRYTTERPVPVVLTTYERTYYPGEAVVVEPDEIDDGSTGGVTGDLTIPIHSKRLNVVGGPAGDATPDEPAVTLWQTGDYALELLVMNAAGNVATSTVCLTTVFTVYPPLATNTGASAWGHRSAILRGEVLDIGGDVPAAWFTYWPLGGSTTNTVSLGYPSGAFDFALSGLTPGTTYAYRIALSNAAAVVYSASVTFTTRDANTTLYVSTNGAHTAGTDWATAYCDLATAFELAEPGDTIRIAGQTFAAPGQSATHPEDAAFVWKDAVGVTLRGGYEASAALAPSAHPGPRDADRWPTILTRIGDNARIFSLVAASNCVIDAIGITGGYRSVPPYSGAGVYLSGCRDILFENCRIVTNTIRAAVYSVTPSGSGLYLQESTVTLLNTLVADNLAQAVSPGPKQAQGGGIYVDHKSQLVLMGSRIEHNRAEGHSSTAHGGGLYVAANGRLQVSATLLRGNSAWDNHSNNLGYGGAIANAGSMHLINSLVIQNLTKTQFSDGVWSGSAAAVGVIESSTVAHNNSGVGIRYDGGTIALTNSIVWGHATDLAGFPTHATGRLSTVGYSLFATSHDMAGVNGCLGGPPNFVDAPAGDYRLSAARKMAPGPLSPAIDAGITLPWMMETCDLAGNRRVVNIVDMGALEVPAAPGSVILLR